MTDFKAKIISELDVLRRISVTETAGVFKARVYIAAIKTLTGLPHIHSMADLPAKQKDDGLGKEVLIKIAKIIEHGQLEISPAARAAASALEVFQGIYGVGPKKAQDLIKAGYTTIADVRAASVADAKLFNKNQKIGLCYYEQLLDRIPRPEMEQHAVILMAAKPAMLTGVIVGSYRRGKPDSGDIDMLLCSQGADDASAALTAFVGTLQTEGYIKEVLAHGDHKCMAISELPGVHGRRLDLLITPPSEFPFAVFYFTGCDTFNVAVRSHALTRGYTLNEHALTHVTSGKQVKGIKTEKDIFTALKLKWIEPVDRTGPDMVIPI